MSLYDYIYCHVKLPEVIIEGKKIEFPKDKVWYLRDFDCLQDIYHINLNKNLLLKDSIWSIETDGYSESHFEGPFNIVNFHGIIQLYDNYQIEENEYFICFYAKFTDGYLVSLTPRVEKLIFKPKDD